MLERLNILFLTLFVLLLVGAGAYIYLDTSREDRLIIAAGARSSEGFQLVEAIAEVVRRHHPKLDIEVIETGGSLDNSRLIPRQQSLDRRGPCRPGHDASGRR